MFRTKIEDDGDHPPILLTLTFRWIFKVIVDSMMAVEIKQTLENLIFYSLRKRY